MDAVDMLLTRRSIREFKSEPIPQDVLQDIVRIASYAPSWKNTQVARYNIIQDRKKINFIASDCVLGFSFNTTTIQNCTNLVVVSYVNGRSGYERDGSFSTKKGDRWQMFDAGIAAQTFCLAAWTHNIGSVILGIMDEDKISSYINLPENETVAALIAIGYPKNDVEAPKRKSVDQLLRLI